MVVGMKNRVKYEKNRNLLIAENLRASKDPV